jgi:hypothetical protein
MDQTTSTSSTPLPTCIAQTGAFQIQFVSNSGRDPYVLTVDGNHEWYAVGVWNRASSLGDGDHSSITFNFDANGNLKLAQKRTAQDLDYWYVYSRYHSSVSTFMPAMSPKGKVDEWLLDNSVTNIKGCVDIVTGEVKLDSVGRRNILMCYEQFYMSSGSGMDAFSEETENPCIVVQAFAIPIDSSASSATSSTSSITSVSLLSVVLF